MKRKLWILPLSLAVSATLSAQITFYDDFSGSDLDAATWTTGGYASTAHVQAVGGGELIVSLDSNWGHSHHSYAQTIRTDFDFFSSPLDITWTLGPSGLGTTLPYVPNATELWNGNVDDVHAGWGITSGAEDTNLLTGGNASSIFFGVVFVEPPEATQITDDPSTLEMIPTIMGQEITSIPSSVNVVLDDTNAVLTLTGSDFVSTASNSITVAHGKSAADFVDYRLTNFFEHRVWTENAILSSTDSISVVPEPSEVAFALGFVALGLVAFRRRFSNR